MLNRHLASAARARLRLSAPSRRSGDRRHRCRDRNLKDVVSSHSANGEPSLRPPGLPPVGLSRRKQLIWEASERSAAKLDYWRSINAEFHKADAEYLRFLVRPGLRILELGCGNGDLLAALSPSFGVGVDFSPAMIDLARRRHPGLEFLRGDVEALDRLPALAGRTFDVILMSDTIGVLEDLQSTFGRLHAMCEADTRLIVSYYSQLWEPVIRLAERLCAKMPTPMQNWLSSSDISEILALAAFEEIKREWRQILPKRLWGIGPFLNRYLGPLPLIRKLAVRYYLVLRSLRAAKPTRPSLSIVIPCRNERGNIAAAIARIPQIAPEQEIIFVEGHSEDGTFEEILRAKEANPGLAITALVQRGKGKGDAVRQGFDAARGDILLILDADLTVPPEDIPKFYDALASGKAEFVLGSRLVYPMERRAMRPLNRIANRIFALLFSYLLNQRVSDTLCGTKALRRTHYRQLAAGRGYFGEFDPFGDFDLIFGASKLNLRLAEIPIRYQARQYGESQISRFRDGWLLLRMVAFAWRKLKAI
jgi:ubiquinone/menaquinone biosynthesis C-methylase UbiE